LASSAQAQFVTTYFTEDFESAPVQDNGEHPTTGEQGREAFTFDAVWTDVPPAGWSVDDSGVASAGNDDAGVMEWEGWAFTQGEWWAGVAGDQDRTVFTDPAKNGGKNRGIVAVADPDEWDDFNNTVPPYFNALMTTPVFQTPGLDGKSLGVMFDSSWRDEAFDDGPAPQLNNQTAVILASYNGSPFSEILRWESDPADPNFKDDAANETVMFNVNPPADTTNVQLRFGLLESANDWWWAIDDVKVGAVPEPGTLTLGACGLALIGLARRRGCQV